MCRQSKNRFILLSLVLVSAATTSCVKAPPVSGYGLLTIHQQGSFAVGGTVVTNPGTFDPYKPTPDGATLHGDPSRRSTLSWGPT